MSAAFMLHSGARDSHTHTHTQHTHTHKHSLTHTLTHTQHTTHNTHRHKHTHTQKKKRQAPGPCRANPISWRILKLATTRIRPDLPGSDPSTTPPVYAVEHLCMSESSRPVSESGLRDSDLAERAQRRRATPAAPSRWRRMFRGGACPSRAHKQLRRRMFRGGAGQNKTGASHGRSRSKQKSVSESRRAQARGGGPGEGGP